MGINQKTEKLVGFLVSIHLVAGALGVVSGIFYGFLAGLAIFTISIILLPLLLHYMYSDRNNE